MNNPLPLKKLRDKTKNLNTSLLAKQILDILLKKYLVFTVFVCLLCGTYSVLNHVFSSGEMFFYYSLGNNFLGFRPNNFFGLFSVLEVSIESLQIILCISYFIFVFLLAVILTIQLKRIKSVDARLQALLLFMLFIIPLISFELNGFFSLSLLAALILMIPAYALIFKGKNPVTAIFIISLSQIIECRTIIIVISVMIIQLICGNVFKADNSKKTKRVMIAAAAVSAVVFVVTEMFYRNSVSQDMSSITDYLNTVYINENTDLLTKTVYSKMIEDFSQAEELLTLTPLYVIFLPLKGFFRISNAVSVLQDILLVNNLILIAFVFLWFILYSYSRLLWKDKKLKCIFCIVCFLLVISVFDSARTFNSLLIISCAFYLYRFLIVKKMKPDINLRMFAIAAVAVIILKHYFRIFCYDPSNFSYLHYYMSYQSFDFMPREVIASVYQAVFGYTLPTDRLDIIMRIAETVMFTVILIFLRKIYTGSSDNRAMKITGVLITAFILSPGLSFLFHKENAFKLDMYIYMLAFMAVYLIIKNGLSMWLIPIICGLCMFIHHIFACVLFPIVFILLVYRAFINSGKHYARNISVLTLSFAVVALIFVWFTFIHVPPEGLTVEYVVNNINERSEKSFSILKETVKYVWLDRDKEHVSYYSSMITSGQVRNAVLYFILTSPLTATFVYALKKSASFESKRISKLAYLLMGLSLLAHIPPYITDTDYGRWCGYFTMTSIITLVALTVIQPDDKKWYRDINEKTLKVWLCGLVILLSILPTTNDFLNKLVLFTE